MHLESLVEHLSQLVDAVVMNGRLSVLQWLFHDFEQWNVQQTALEQAAASNSIKILDVLPLYKFNWTIH